DVVAEDVRVPQDLTLSVDEPSTLDGPLGRVPIICSMAAAYGAHALGIAQSAVDTLIELASTKRPPEGPALRERPSLLVDVARQGAALEAARTTCMRARRGRGARRAPGGRPRSTRSRLCGAQA